MFESVRQIAKTVGPAAAAGYAAARALQICTRGKARMISYRLVAQPVPPQSTASARTAGAIEWRHVQAGDGIAAQFPRPPAVIDRRFRDGARCLAAVKGGKLIGFLWYQPGEYVEDEVRCRYRFDPAVAVWDFDVYVDPDHRLSRLFARLWDYAHAELRASGYRWTLSRISAFNPASIAAHARLGARRLGSVLFFVAGCVQVSFASIAPYFHVSWREDMRPSLYLDPK